jgi:hypothetical protein
MRIKIIFLGIIGVLFLGSCGGSKSADDSSKKYFITLADQIEETSKSKSVSADGDGISDIATFKIGNASLQLFEYYNVSKTSPARTKGNIYGAIIEFEDEIEGRATITDVISTGENSIGENFNIIGDFKGLNGELGSFSVSLFDM